VDESGRAIRHECGTCHEFLRPAETEAGVATVGIGGFIHPVVLEGPHATMRCDKCHTGGVEPQPTCAGCHSDVAGFRAGTLAALQPFGISPEPMAELVDCKDCHDLSRPHTLQAIDAHCMDCHSDDEEQFAGMLASWKSELDPLLQSAAASSVGQAQDVLKRLRRAGPLHNPGAARKLLEALSDGPAAANAARRNGGDP
jgi:hypothetical protein